MSERPTDTLKKTTSVRAAIRHLQPALAYRPDVRWYMAQARDMCPEQARVRADPLDRDGIGLNGDSANLPPVLSCRGGCIVTAKNPDNISPEEQPEWLAQGQRDLQAFLNDPAEVARVQRSTENLLCLRPVSWPALQDELLTAYTACCRPGG